MGLETSTQALVADKGCQKGSQNVTQELHEYHWVKAAVWSEQTCSWRLCRCSPERKFKCIHTLLMVWPIVLLWGNKVSFWNKHCYMHTGVCVCARARTASSGLLESNVVSLGKWLLTFLRYCMYNYSPFLRAIFLIPGWSHHTYISPLFVPCWLLFLDCLSLKMMTLYFSEILGATHLVTQQHIWEDSSRTD
jgi:hypothetical protein